MVAATLAGVTWSYDLPDVEVVEVLFPPSFGTVTMFMFWPFVPIIEKLFTIIIARCFCARLTWSSVNSIGMKAILGPCKNCKKC